MAKSVGRPALIDDESQNMINKYLSEIEELKIKIKQVQLDATLKLKEERNRNKRGVGRPRGSTKKIVIDNEIIIDDLI